MKNIKRLIIILLIAIIIISGAIIILRKIQNEYNEENVEELDTGKTYENNDNGFQILEDPNVFFSVENALSNYLEVISYRVEDDEDNRYDIKSKEEQRDIILKLLDKKYTNKNSLNQENIYQYINKINYDYNLIPIDIRVRYDENIITYIMNVYLENIENMQLEERYYVIRKDNRNTTFSIEPILDEVNNLDEISIENNEERIEKNDYNQYNIETISIERLVKIYMDHFNHMMVYHPEIAYNKYLDEEYRNIKFGNIDEFKEYVEKNEEEIQSIRATKYLVENENDGKKYVILDQYHNTYEFYETYTMAYKVKLDTYTIPTEKFTTTYTSSSNQKKVMMNVDKWVQMLNNRDYTAAYNLLDETYKNNAFGSEEQFETTMREKLPLHYKVEYSNFSEENETYMLDITLTDITEEEEGSVQISIIMQLKEDLDFVMSFSFQE